MQIINCLLVFQTYHKFKKKKRNQRSQQEKRVCIEQFTSGCSKTMRQARTWSLENSISESLYSTTEGLVGAGPKNVDIHNIAANSGKTHTVLAILGKKKKTNK